MVSQLVSCLRCLLPSAFACPSLLVLVRHIVDAFYPSLNHLITNTVVDVVVVVVVVVAAVVVGCDEQVDL